MHCRTELHPASGVPCSMPTKLRRPAGAVAGRPTLHMPAARPAPAAAPHHTHALGTAPLAPATVSSPLLTSSPSLAAAGHRRFPERRAFSAAGESAAAAARPDTGRLAAAARPGYGSAAYGSTGRPVTRRPTIAPPTEPSSSFALPPRRVAPAPVSNALGRCCTLTAPFPARTSFVLGRDAHGRETSSCSALEDLLPTQGTCQTSIEGFVHCRTDGNAHSKTAAMQRPETSAAVGPLAAGRLRSSAEPRAAPAAVSHVQPCFGRLHVSALPCLTTLRLVYMIVRQVLGCRASGLGGAVFHLLCEQSDCACRGDRVCLCCAGEAKGAAAETACPIAPAQSTHWPQPDAGASSVSAESVQRCNSLYKTAVHFSSLHCIQRHSVGNPMERILAPPAG